MNLFLVILQAVLIIILGVFPNFFVVINSNQVVWYKRLTNYGILMIFVMLIIMGLTIYTEIQKEIDNKKTQASNEQAQKELRESNQLLLDDNKKNTTLLENIQNALKTSKLEYDSNTKSIVSNDVNAHSNGNIFSLVTGGSSRVSGIHMSGNSINTTMQMDYYEFLGTIAQTRVKYGITNRNIHFGSFKGTNGRRYMPPIEKVLIDNGFTIVQRFYDYPEVPGYDTKGGKVMVINRELYLILGDLIPVK